MSTPYFYTSSPYYAYQPTPYIDPNTNQPSPFIPNLTLYPSSPYISPHHSPHGSAPNTPKRRAVHFDDEGWEEPRPPRARRPSWHGQDPAVIPPQSPYLGYAPAFIPPPTYNHQRRHSFGASPYPPTFGPAPYLPWSAYALPTHPSSPWMYPNQPPTFQIHPYLNGESPHPDFFFDLSSLSFAPTKYVGPGQIVMLSEEELHQAATHPPINRMRIVCDVIPQWPVDLEYNPYNDQRSPGHPYATAPAIPITLSDVLVMIHRSLQTRISHIDWARLSSSEETAIARAYTKRCRNNPSLAEFQKSQGVRRVDFLLDKTIFRGLIRVPGEEGSHTMKLITSSR